jgi:5-methyltetrahydropteroyltriglutamate--homocysteine methyltransferase
MGTKGIFKTLGARKTVQIINAAFQQKVDAGVEAPTYPQYQDMNEQFLSVIRDPENIEEPFKSKKKLPG